MQICIPIGQLRIILWNTMRDGVMNRRTIEVMTVWQEEGERPWLGMTNWRSETRRLANWIWISRVDMKWRRMHREWRRPQLHLIELERPCRVTDKWTRMGRNGHMCRRTTPRLHNISSCSMFPSFTTRWNAGSFTTDDPGTKIWKR